MKFTSSNSLVHNQSIDLKHIRGGAVNQIVNIANTGSSDGCGAPGATNAANYISKSLKIQLYSGGVVVKSLAAIVYGFTDPQQGGFVAQYADIPETLSNDSVAQQMNMRLYFRLARYQGERGNVGFAGSSTVANCARVQTLALTGAPSGGTFTLAWNGETTAPIAFNASTAAVQSALQALANLGTNVACTGGPLPSSPVTITFSGQLNGTNVNILTGNGAALTGGTMPSVSLQVTQWAGGATYFAAGEMMTAEGESAGNRYYTTHPLAWSEDLGMFVIQRAAEHSAVNRRIFVQGIVKIINGNQLSWVNLSDSSYPCSDKEILVYSDRYTTANPPQSAPPPLTENQSSGNAGTYPYESALPTGQLPSLALVGQGANFYVKIDFGARYKAQSIQAELYMYPAAHPSSYNYGIQAVANQPSGNTSQVWIWFWKDDYSLLNPANGAGALYTIHSFSGDNGFTGFQANDDIRIPVWGYIEPAGENAAGC